MRKTPIHPLMATVLLLGTLVLGSSGRAATPIIPGFERWLNDDILWNSHTGFTHKQLMTWIADHPDRRIIDLEVEEFFGIGAGDWEKNKFAFVWVENVDDFKSEWGIQFFLGESALTELKKSKNERPIDIEVSLIGVSPVYTIVTVPHGDYDWNFIPFMQSKEYNEWHSSVVAAGFRPVDVEAGFGDAHVPVLFGAGLYVENPEGLDFMVTHFGPANQGIIEGVMDMQLIDADRVPDKWLDVQGYQPEFWSYVGVFTEIPQTTLFLTDSFKDEHDIFAMANDVRMIDIERTGEIKNDCKQTIISSCNPEYESGPLYTCLYLNHDDSDQPDDPPGSDGPGPNDPPD